MILIVHLERNLQFGQLIYDSSKANWIAVAIKYLKGIFEKVDQNVFLRGVLNMFHQLLLTVCQEFLHN